MIARSFRSVIWVATVGGAALSCYMVSLRVATERADLAKVERQIIAAKHDIRSLQTELGTRGRMTQLEDWNANVLALSAPTSAQFVKDQMTLARFEKPQSTLGEAAGAEVRLASADTGAAAAPGAPAPQAAGSAPAAQPAPAQQQAAKSALGVVNAIAHPAPAPAQPMVHRASYTPGEAKSPLPAAAAAAKPLPVKSAAKKASKPVEAAKAEGHPKPEREAKAEHQVKPERQAKIEPKTQKQAKPVPAHETAAAKPVAAKLAPEKKLAARGKAPHHPAAQESDAD